jgi:holo-[acyl-carrier protein] synthase
MSATFPLKMTSIAADASRLLEQSLGTHGQVRVGIDVVSISEFGLTMATKGGAAFVRTRFTEAEQAYCEGRPERLAGRWAAKEAVAKAVGTGFRGLRPRQIEIVHQPWGEPTVSRVGNGPWPSGADGWQWSLSLAHEGDAAVAVALAVTDVATSGHGDDPTLAVPRAEKTHLKPITLD